MNQVALCTERRTQLILDPEACTSVFKTFQVMDYSKAYRGDSQYATFNDSSLRTKYDDSVQKIEAPFEGLYGYGLVSLIDRIRLR